MTREEAVRSVTKAFGDRPFSWGALDCCQLARAVYKAYRGSDPAIGLDYSSEEEAESIIASHGGLDGLIGSILGDSIEPNAASTADILLLNLPKVGEIIGVKVPGGALVPLKVGLFKAPMNYALKGWRI